MHCKGNFRAPGILFGCYRAFILYSYPMTNDDYIYQVQYYQYPYSKYSYEYQVRPLLINRPKPTLLIPELYLYTVPAGHSGPTQTWSHKTNPRCMEVYSN